MNWPQKTEKVREWHGFVAVDLRYKLQCFFAVAQDLKLERQGSVLHGLVNQEHV
jgi:hypothetical protein